MSLHETNPGERWPVKLSAIAELVAVGSDTPCFDLPTRDKFKAVTPF